MTEIRREEQGIEPQPNPSTSPFTRPGVMTGYPLSRDEQEHVDRLADGYEEQDEDED
ncbi:MAG: hypothetical protein ACRDNG_06515 [Gaiellaceae bacterium]